MNIYEYKPEKPFDSYKWYFATKAPTESLGDPVILLGLIDRIAPLADKGDVHYSSDDFAKVMMNMNANTITNVNLGERVGSRNLMRNSSQYWKLFGLIPKETRGIISITDFARDIVSGKVSQFDFASAMIISLKLPNAITYSEREIIKWKNNELVIHPLKIILQVMRDLYKSDPQNGWITNEELYKIIIPMAGDKQRVSRISQFILKFRVDRDYFSTWYDAVPRANDKRYSSEFLRFLSNFGFIEKLDPYQSFRDTMRFGYIGEIDEQINTLINGDWAEERDDLLLALRKFDIDSGIIQSAISRSNYRPNQQRFRKDLIDNMERCAFTGNSLTKVLQAAHIKPYAYGGSDDISNGLLLRADVHILFDAGMLNLRPDPFYKNRCFVEMGSDMNLKNNYPSFSNEVTIQLPNFTNMENIEWRYENRLLGITD